MLSKESQCETNRNTQLLNIIEKANLGEEEQKFFEEMLSNKSLLSIVMEKFIGVE